jgi:hypothetical protein
MCNHNLENESRIYILASREEVNKYYPHGTHARNGTTFRSVPVTML